MIPTSPRRNAASGHSRTHLPQPSGGESKRGAELAAPWTSGGPWPCCRGIRGQRQAPACWGRGGGERGLGILSLGPAFATGVLILGTRPRAWIQICLVPGHMLMERMWPRLVKINSTVSCLPISPENHRLLAEAGTAPPPPRPIGLCSQCCFSEAEGGGDGLWPQGDLGTALPPAARPCHGVSYLLSRPGLQCPL